MREVITATANFKKIDLLNSRTATPLKEADGNRIKVARLGVLNVVENDETKTVGMIVDDTGAGFSCISTNAISVIEDSIELIDEGMSVEFLINVKRSKNDRDFIAITVYEV